jgi:hypothetical protein
VPFAAAFTGFVIGLYAMGALFMKRLMAETMRSSPGG